MGAISSVGRKATIPHLPLHSVVKAVAAAILFCSGLVDLPRAVQVGPVTSQAILTIAYYCGALLLLAMLPVLEAPTPSRTVPLFVFLFWAATSLAWSSSPVNGIQNILAIGIMPLLLLVAEATASMVPDFAFSLVRWLDASVLMAILIYGISVLIWGPANDDWISARSFGVFALFGVATQLARWRYGHTTGLLGAVLITLLIGISESRLALGIAIALFPLAQLPTRGKVRWLKVIGVSLVVLAASYWAFNYFDELRDRFLKGDVSLKIGAVEINASGRTAFWNATLESWRDAPIFGKGAGSAEGLIESVFVTIKHPHNDYIRILHDYGVVGFSIWLIGVGVLLSSLYRVWRRADRANRAEARLHLVAMLALLAFAMEMTAENTMVIVYITAPLGMVVGTALGIERYGATLSWRCKPQRF